MPDAVFGDDDSSNTPLETEEQEQLIPSYISTRAELNEAELLNISNAVHWVGTRNVNVLDGFFLKDLHHRMFGNVWKWAGTYRKTARNIGVDAYQIPTAIRIAIDDAKFWIENGTFEADEIAIRFSHRIVAIHPFPNGNGRHSRMVGDLLARTLDQPFYTWGRLSLVSPSATRAQYIAALRMADHGDFAELIRFARE